jgi:hypothetical protein
MGGTQIRWRSAARIAGIALAAVAAIAALPALMGSDTPPPVPDDVGLIPTQTAVAPLPEPPAPEPPVATPRVKAKARKRTEASKERGAKRRRARKPRQRGETEELDSAPVYAPVPAYGPPANLPEFGIEP